MELVWRFGFGEGGVHMKNGQTLKVPSDLTGEPGTNTLVRGLKRSDMAIHSDLVIIATKLGTKY